MEENWKKDQNKITNQKICLKCDKLFISTKEFSLTIENDFNFLSFTFCDECRNSVNIKDFIGAFAYWTSNWLKDYIKNNEENKGRIENAEIEYPHIGTDWDIEDNEFGEDG